GKEFHQLVTGKLTPGWNKNIPEFPPDTKGMSTRIASGKVMQAFNPNLPGFIGGSADLNPSTHTELKNFGNFENPSMAVGDIQGSVEGGWSYAGRNLHYGV